MCQLFKKREFLLSNIFSFSIRMYKKRKNLLYLQMGKLKLIYVKAIYGKLYVYKNDTFRFSLN